MAIKITDYAGNSLEKAVSGRLHGILSRVRNSGKQIQSSLLSVVKNHFQDTYPGSMHWSPSKVTPQNAKDGKNPEGSISIDVPGVSRAYHDVNIRPKLRRFLTIPVHREALNKSASSFQGLFHVKTKSGSQFLAQARGSSLVLMFLLAKKAFQPRDQRLMPSDSTLANAVFGRISAYLAEAK